MVEKGRLAPDFTLTSDSGEAVDLSSFRGAPVVLYLYPGDDSRLRFFSIRSRPPPGLRSELRPALDRVEPPLLWNPL